MKLLLILFLSFSFSSFAIDTGDGSDGSCNVDSLAVADTHITSAKKNYQCTTLTIDSLLDVFKGGQAGSGGAALVIKVQGDVVIDFPIDLNGSNGLDGDTSSGKAGGSAGAGGFAGGNSTFTDGANGNGAGGGVAGQIPSLPVGATYYGGGGGGGSYKTQSGTSPDDGFDSSGSRITAGSNGATIITSESDFDSSFVGGQGGAAGGAGSDTGSPVSGSSGGGGGGALRIIAGGNITVNAAITSNGGNGGGAGGTVASGGGGGGSGGAIWFQAANDLIINGAGSISTLRGLKGSNDFGLNGGDGGFGGIRLDDGDGVITNSGTVTPAAYTTTFRPTSLVSGTSSISRQYSSSISCARVAMEDQRKFFVLDFFLGILLVVLGQFVVSRREKV